MGTAVVVIGGGPVAQAVPSSWRQADLVIAADSGTDLAHRLGLVPSVVVGDMDSVTPAGLERAKSAGATVERAPVDKDETDFELALRAARAAGVSSVRILGGAAGRLDHLVANLAVLTGPLTEGVDIEAWLGTSRVQILRDRLTVPGWAGMTVSLAAWHGTAHGLRSSGLRWELEGGSLEAGTARGTSNELTGPLARLEVSGGCLSVIAPDAWRSEGVEIHELGGCR
jgi:thiamine pyrophosphokinase